MFLYNILKFIVDSCGDAYSRTVIFMLHMKKKEGKDFFVFCFFHPMKNRRFKRKIMLNFSIVSVLCFGAILSGIRMLNSASDFICENSDVLYDNCKYFHYQARS